MTTNDLATIPQKEERHISEKTTQEKGSNKDQIEDTDLLPPQEAKDATTTKNIKINTKKD